MPHILAFIFLVAISGLIGFFLGSKIRGTTSGGLKLVICFWAVGLGHLFGGLIGAPTFGLLAGIFTGLVGSLAGLALGYKTGR